MTLNLHGPDPTNHGSDRTSLKPCGYQTTLSDTNISTEYR
jgi:hypothetical protein